MKYIKSCGFITFKQINNDTFYLIIKSINGDVGFPKGHIEPGESELQTAVRELKEETNIDVEVISGFRHQIEYKLPKKNDTTKQSVYFLGKCVTDFIIPQEAEVADAFFAAYEEALNTLTFEETKKMLMEAERFIRSKPIDII